MRQIDMSDYLNILGELLENKNETILVTNKETCILQGVDTLNIDYCKESNLKIYKTHYAGGTIINFKDDVCIGNYQEKHNNFGNDFLQMLGKYLTDKGLSVSISDNDLLVDNKYKIASFMSVFINNCLYTAIHISINMDLKLINAICTKTMNKIPKGLNDFGISQEDILNFLNSLNLCV